MRRARRNSKAWMDSSSNFSTLEIFVEKLGEQERAFSTHVPENSTAVLHIKRVLKLNVTNRSV